MLKRTNSAEEIHVSLAAKSFDAGQNEVQFESASDSQGQIEKLLSQYSKVAIETPIRPFHESNLQEILKKVDYGVLCLLEGTWVSHIHNGKNDRKFIGSGIHTTIMPSPGTNAGTIPGKYSFECEEYIEKLTFNLVEGGVRNRGGANEQFCGAIKYEQSIKSVNKVGDQLKYTPIHEENGMYLWLSDVFNYAATEKTIKDDRGIHAIAPDNENKDLYKSGYQDETLFHIINEKGEKEYVTLENLNGRDYFDILPAKELKPGAGQTGPYFIPDYSISRSGVIPHGSTITLLGDMVPTVVKVDGKEKVVYVLTSAPDFPEGKAAWKYDHLSISRTMGGAGASADPINLDDPAPAWVTQVLDDVNDPGENKIYTQRILAHPLYPYSVRPDLRLRDSNTGENIVNHAFIQMSSKNKTGAQGGVLNVPFVNRFVPAVEMNMRMWIETVKEGDKEILQLQYEQIIFFEFDFGDDGGTTSWPHIQVNTLRKIDDVSAEEKRLIEEQFSASKAAAASGCPYHKE